MERPPASFQTLIVFLLPAFHISVHKDKLYIFNNILLVFRILWIPQFYGFPEIWSIITAKEFIDWIPATFFQFLPFIAKGPYCRGPASVQIKSQPDNFSAASCCPFFVQTLWFNTAWSPQTPPEDRWALCDIRLHILPGAGSQNKSSHVPDF